MCFIHVCIRSIINPNSCSYSRHLIWEWCFRMMLFTVGSKNFQWLEIGGSLQMITTHSTSSTILRAVWVNFPFFAVTLELRLYAMYGRSRKILAILLFLIACEACAMSVIFGVSKAGLIGEWDILSIRSISMDIDMQSQIILLWEYLSAQTMTRLVNIGLHSIGPRHFASNLSYYFWLCTKHGSTVTRLKGVGLCVLSRARAYCTFS